MGKDVPRSFEKIRSGEQLNLKMRGFTNVASLTAAGLTAAKNVGALVFLSTGGTGSVPCLAISDGTNLKQVAIGLNAIRIALTGCILLSVGLGGRCCQWIR